jgi:glycosyltransferase involved in cell wall biosynthesis
VKVAVFTTSYPRHEGDLAGRFVFDLVERLRAQGVEIQVVGPGAYRDYGLTGSGGAGLVASVRRRPWLALPLLVSMTRALRRAARDADLVHANWLAGALVARFAGRPVVVTLHGSGTAGRFSDLGLAEGSPRVVRWLLRPARAVIAVSQVLAEAMRAAGVENVHEIPYGVEIPAQVGPEDEPPAVLFAGRLSPEKRIDVVAAATEGLPRIVAGDGPLRSLLPDALGFVPQAELFPLYERAAVVLLVSEREGLPNVVLEAMARGRTVVSTPVGGIPSVIEDGVTGFLVPIGDVAATRAAIERALGDPELRRRVGAAARERVSEYCSWDRVTERTLEIYAAAVESGRVGEA